VSVWLTVFCAPPCLLSHLQMPKQFTFQSNARPSLFAYPPPIELKKAEEKKTVKKATLSVTAKAKVTTAAESCGLPL
jgi:hypothetical protein